MAKNIFGESLIPCSTDPLTGFYRDGCCETGPEDRGQHTVCAVMTEEFLQFSRARGNDLITPLPQWQFPGLKAGDHWCLCASRWAEALEACHENCLRIVPRDQLIAHAYRKVEG